MTVTMEEVTPVVIPFPLLENPDPAQLTPLIQRAFSSAPTSLGLVIISDLPPSFPALRERLLLLSNAFAQLDEPTREKYADPATNFSFGWSCGKEVMNGKPDKLKGSFYNNPSYDESPGINRPVDRNIWPTGEQGCEGYEQAFKDLCALMVKVGGLVARACDKALVKDGEHGLATTRTVEELVMSSRANKARLLHYFPREDTVFSLPPVGSVASAEPADETVDDSWCGTHVDHSLLTVLCPAMFLFHPTCASETLEPLQIPAPSKATGLFIKTRAGKTIKATIPPNCLAMQTGETLELLSSNRLAATPHFVNSTSSTLGEDALEAIDRKRREDESWSEVESGTISRETLAVFLQPNVDEVVSPQGETFGQFTERVLQRHY